MKRRRLVKGKYLSGSHRKVALTVPMREWRQTPKMKSLFRKMEALRKARRRLSNDVLGTPGMTRAQKAEAKRLDLAYREVERLLVVETRRANRLPQRVENFRKKAKPTKRRKKPAQRKPMTLAQVRAVLLREKFLKKGRKR